VPPPVAPVAPVSVTASDEPNVSPATRYDADGMVLASDHFDYASAIILGIVEGVTEYLPVSSTGHLILTDELLGLNDDVRQVIGVKGLPLSQYEKAPKHERILKKIKKFLSKEPPPAVPEQKITKKFTLKDAADAYIVVIQFGAILAVLLAYWKRVSGLCLGLFRRERKSYKLAGNLIIAFLPAAGVGFVFKDLIEQNLFGVAPVAIALAVGALLMLGVEYWYRERRKKRNAAIAAGEKVLRSPDLHELSPARALGIGCAQCLALWPGTSRSMATICGGYLVGLSPARATEFSFLLGLLTLTCASVYKCITEGAKITATFETGPLALGLIVAAITAFASVKWLVAWINKHGLWVFAVYRILLAAILFAFFM